MNAKINLHELDNKIIDKIYERFPDAKIRSKDDLWLWKLAPKRFKKYATTIGKTIWWPVHDPLEDPDALLLIHEYDHLAYFYEHGFLKTAFRYLSPQINSLLFLVAFLFGWLTNASIGLLIVLGAISLIKLLPFSSYSRAHIEARAFALQILTAEVINYQPDFYKLHAEKQLTSWNYYKPLWSKQKARDFLTAYMDINVQDMSLAAQDVYDVVHEMLNRN